MTRQLEEAKTGSDLASCWHSIACDGLRSSLRCGEDRHRWGGYELGSPLYSPLIATLSIDQYFRSACSSEWKFLSMMRQAPSHVVFAEPPWPESSLVVGFCSSSCLHAAVLIQTCLVAYRHWVLLYYIC